VLTSPNLRGDDVAELQATLGRIGFDCGRVDGIFGPRTARALADFQANCGLGADGACGAETIRTLTRVSGHTGSGPGVASVREHDHLRHRSPTLSSLNIVVGQFGALGSIARAAARELRRHGALVLSLDEPDANVQADAANRFGADAYVGLDAGNGDQTVVHYYRVPAFMSVGGRSLAESMSVTLAACGLDVMAPQGMRLPILRETRMPAVLCLVAPVRPLVDAAVAIGHAMATALQVWAENPSSP
jgi:N-acetylmuramoyl-L-alanine amidase